jgi:hypothetical protein
MLTVHRLPGNSFDPTAITGYKQFIAGEQHLINVVAG